MLISFIENKEIDTIWLLIQIDTVWLLPQN